VLGDVGFDFGESEGVGKVKWLVRVGVGGWGWGGGEGGVGVELGEELMVLAVG
jgi:hypothetical protein